MVRISSRAARVFLACALVTSAAMGSEPVASIASSSAGIVLPRSPAAASSAVDFLTRLSTRSGVSRIELELPRAAASAVQGLARLAEADWAAGRFADAIASARRLEAAGVAVSVAASFARPTHGEGPTLGSNALIGTPYGGGSATDSGLDYDRATGHLFALVRGTSTFSLFMSSDGGAIWDETASLMDAGGLGAMDLAVVGGWVYVSYDSPSNSELRLRRALVTDGTFDSGYFHQTMLAYPSGTIVEVSAAANADGGDNRFYAGARFSDSTIRCLYTVATSGTTFYDLTPSTVAAADGPSIAYDSGYQGTGYFMFLSFSDAAGAVHVYRYETDNGWDEAGVFPTGGGSSTSVSAFRGTVLMAFQNLGTGGDPQGVYRISYNQGDSWSGATLSSGEGEHYFRPLVSARSGTGTAYLVQYDAGAEDRLLFTQRFNYAPSGLWEASQELNDRDFPLNSQAVDFEWVGSGWGVTYPDNAGAVWFTLSPAIFYSGFERGDATEWSLVTP